MIATLVVTLGNTGETLVQASARIMGDMRGVTAFGLDWDADMDHAKHSLGKRIQELDQGQGVLLLTDIIGGTPNNISLAFAKSERVEVVSGVNLPMVVKAMSLPPQLSLDDAARSVCLQTRQSIVVASKRKDDAA